MVASAAWRAERAAAPLPPGEPRRRSAWGPAMAGPGLRRRLRAGPRERGQRALPAAWRALALTCWAAPPSSSALERRTERQARQRWEELGLAGFGRRHNLSRDELRGFLRHSEEAAAAGVPGGGRRAPALGLLGAFYFVGTVVSTIGECAPGGGGCPALPSASRLGAPLRPAGRRGGARARTNRRQALLCCLR